MSRLKADLILLVVAIIWGTGFIAQKAGMGAGLGPMGFIAARFVFSILMVLPFAWLEHKKFKVADSNSAQPYFTLTQLLPIGVAFFGGVAMQQLGIATTSVTNAGFLTGLYVVMVPFIAWALSGIAPRGFVWAACLLAILGTWCLNGGHLAAFSVGDYIVIGCAAFFALQVTLTGHVLKNCKRPFALVLWQYAFCFVLAVIGAALFEDNTWQGMIENLPAIAYAGIASGGVAYTLQAVAQQYTPASDAAIIMSAEALVAAIAGALIMGDSLTPLGLLGCALILCAIVLVECGDIIITKWQTLKLKRVKA